MNFDYSSNYKNLMAQNAYPNFGKNNVAQQPQKVGGSEQVFAPKHQSEDPKKAGSEASIGEQLSQVRAIGLQKAQGFQNGAGGTNNPDDHKIFTLA